MSWRRFTALLRGLSGSSLWVALRRAEAQGTGTRRLTDPAAIEDFMRGLATDTVATATAVT